MQVGFVEEEGVEPVYSSLMSVQSPVSLVIAIPLAGQRTLSSDNLMWIFVLKMSLVYVDT